MRRLTLLCSFVAVATAALAQDAQQPDRRPEGPREFRGEGRPGGEFRMGMGGRSGEWMQRMFQRTAEDLDLDETQKAEFDRLAQPHIDRMSEMRERWNEVREAQEAGDEARARQLREPLMRAGNPGDAIGEILTEMEPSLRPEQVEKADNIRDRMQGESDNRDRMRKITTELPETLQLDETQKAQYEELVAKSREDMGNRFAAMRPLFEQMREAREAGDSAKVRELEKQMEAQRGDMNPQYDAFFTQVDALLRDDQKQLLANFRDELGVGAAGEANQKGGTTDVRAILQAAKRVKLDAGQKKELKDIEDDAMKSWREAGRDMAARADLARQVREEISKLLDETQQTRFVQLLERLDKKSVRR